VFSARLGNHEKIIFFYLSIYFKKLWKQLRKDIGLPDVKNKEVDNIVKEYESNGGVTL
jgi:hypothetical protein